MAEAEFTTFDSTDAKPTGSAGSAASDGRPQWNPGGSDASRFLTCRNDDCDNRHVDPEIGRILGDERGRVHACPDCTAWAALKQGAAADPTFEHRVENATRLRHGAFGLGQ